MWKPRFRLAQLELGAAGTTSSPELDEVVDQIDHRQHARPAADDGQHDDAEGRLQLRVLDNRLFSTTSGISPAFSSMTTRTPSAIRSSRRIGNALDRLFAMQLANLWRRARPC